MPTLLLRAPRIALLLAACLAPVAVARGQEASRPAAQPGAARHSLGADTADRAAVDDLSDMLTGRVPGLVAQQRSGALRAGADIRLRGRATFLSSSDPAVFVDGVRVDSRSSSSTLLESYAAPSALDELDPEDIERIEILPGPAAAWEYGAGAAGGVLLVSTRRGDPGRLRWRAHTEQGAATDAATYPANVTGWTTVNGTPQPTCFYWHQASGSCSLDSLASFNPLEAASPFRAAHRSRIGVSGTGDTPLGSVRIGAGHEADDGVLATASRRALRASAGVAATPLPTVSLDVHAAFQQSVLRSPEGIETATVHEAGLRGAASDDPERRGFAEPLETLLARLPRRDGDRLRAGASATWRARSWLRADATAGIERSDVEEHFRDAYSDGFGTPYDIRRTFDERYTSYTFAASATADWRASASLRAATTVGARQQRLQTRSSSMDSLGSGDMFSVTRLWRRMDVSALGLFVQQRLDWRERVTASVGLRAENHDKGVTFGNVDDVLTPAASLAWDVGRVPLLAGAGFESLRLRGAWAEVVRSPEALVTLPFAYLAGGELEPERTREIEAGFDARTRDGRVGLSMTYYRQRTGNALLPVPVASPSGYYTAPRNVALVRSQGATAQLALALVRGARWSWDVTLQGSMNSSRLIGLSGVPPIAGDLVGESVDSRYVHHVTSAVDGNGDGVIAPGEVAFGPARFQGSGFPRQEAALWTRVGLGARASASLLLDYRGDYQQANLTRLVRCFTRVCAEMFDAGLSRDEQTRIASILATSAESADVLENGRFVRLREVALSLAFPERWATRLGASSARLTFAGRNLALWTPYRGLDPEVRAHAPVGGPYLNGLVGDHFAPPLTRDFSARLELGW